jgi:hypothetical protein
LLLSLLALVIACDGGGDGPPGDALSAVDERYSEILLRLGAADRDTTRNVHNKDARRRKAEAEGEKVAFFQDPEVIAAIEGAQAAPEGSALRVRGDTYARQSLEARAWTEAEKAEETRLLGELDELASAEAEWFAPDRTRFALTRDWKEVSERADSLDDAVRQDLSRAFVAHRMRLAGDTLVKVVKLRNTVAVRAGYPTYYELASAAQGVTLADLDAVMGELEAAVVPFFAADRAAVAATGQVDDFANHPRLQRLAGLGTDADRAEGYFDADLAEERVVTAYRDMGFDVSALQLYTGPSRMVRPGVNGFAIQPPKYVAIVMSVDDRWSAWSYEALIHELGHGVWWMNLDPATAASPAAWEPDPRWFEGYAQFFERVLAEPDFTSRYVPELPEADRRAFRDAHVRGVAEGIAGGIVTVAAERRLYENPDDLAGAFRTAVDRRGALTGAPPPPEGAIPYDPALLSGLVWHYPAYSPNFLYAYMTEARLFDAVTTAIGNPVANPKLAPFLVEKLIQQPVTTPFSARLDAIAPGARTAALQTYLNRE